MKSNLLILASGAGTRNAMFTYNNALPKCLTSVGDKTCIEAIVDSYVGGMLDIDTIYIACQNRHRTAIEEVLKFRGYFDKFNIELVSFEQTKSAYASVKTAIDMIGSDAVCNANWYINWSDVFTDNMPAVTEPTIFVDAKYQHRNLAYSLSKVNVVSTDNMKGNVPGIFYVPGQTLFDCLQCNADCLDIDIALTTFAAFTLHELDNVYDIGDYDKYNAYMQSIKSENVCRYFNEIKVDKNVVYKRPKTEHGIKLHDIELQYYRAYGNSGTALAKLLGYDATTKTMTLERIKGSTCHAIADSKANAATKLTSVNKMIKLFKEAVKTFDDVSVNIVDDEQAIYEAMRNEFVDMIDKRVKPCSAMIDAAIASNNIVSIEGMRIVTYDKLIAAVSNWFEQAYANGAFEVGLTHGDPNTDNTLLSKDGIRFVDPRGYFGKLKTLGLGVKQYDLAKFVYGFSGYGKFNSAEFIAVNITDGNVDVFVGPTEQPNITDVSLFNINVPLDIKVLVGIIWVKLTSYIINDPMKSVAAYLYGNALLTKLLNIR